jgi:hypothetical protein
MKDWFGDNLGPLTQRILGSFDEKKDEYNITIKGLYPVGTNNSGNGDQCGCDTSIVSTSQDDDDIRNLENTTILRDESNLNIGSVSVGDKDFYNSEVTLTFSERAKGWISFKSFVPESGVSINNEYYTFKDGEMYKHHSNLNHNTFYEPLLGDDAFTESSVTLLFNDQPGTVKSFSTLNYEGSQARNKANLLDSEYYNLVQRDGWYVSDIKTNLQESSYLEFKSKEKKWFTYIKGDTTTLQNLDEREFSVQGVGSYDFMNVVGAEAKQDVCLTITPSINCTPVPGCMDPNALNYNPNANVDDSSCTYPPEPVYGCTDATANNHDPLATVDDGSCTYDVLGCTDPTATNFNPSANVDDGSCVYPVEEETVYTSPPCYPTHPIVANAHSSNPQFVIDYPWTAGNWGYAEDGLAAAAIMTNSDFGLQTANPNVAPYNWVRTTYNNISVEKIWTRNFYFAVNLHQWEYYPTRLIEALENKGFTDDSGVPFAVTGTNVAWQSGNYYPLVEITNMDGPSITAGLYWQFLAPRDVAGNFEYTSWVQFCGFLNSLEDNAGVKILPTIDPMTQDYGDVREMVHAFNQQERTIDGELFFHSIPNWLTEGAQHCALNTDGTSSLWP